MLKVYQLVTSFLIFSFLIVTWYFYVEDRFLFKINGLEISTETEVVKSGDILRIGISTDGSVASHWLGRPLHHYVLVLSLEGKLHVVHTWYKKLTSHGNIHIPPSYQVQPFDEFKNYSNLQIVEIFRHPDLCPKDFSMKDLTSIIRSFGNSVRCYITIMNLLNKIYPELNLNFGITGASILRNNCLWSFLFYKPLYFETTLLTSGFKVSKIMLLKNLINESNINVPNIVCNRNVTF